MKLYSIRWSIGNGWQHIHERDCTIENASQWLDIFKKDDPNTLFILSEKKLPLKTDPKKYNLT